MSGKIHRIKSTDGFVILQKSVLKDASLSWKAKGLHCYLMQLPSDWNINIADLSNRSTDGRDSTAAAMRELIKSGYAERQKQFDEQGKFAGYDYHIFEEVNGKSVNGKSVNGKSVNGKSVNGKSVTTKKEENKELIILNTNLGETENFSENETNKNFEKIGPIEIPENHLPFKSGKMEQAAPGGGPTQKAHDDAIDEYVKATMPPAAILLSNPDPVGTASEIAADFFKKNPDTVRIWCDNARFSGTVSDLENEVRKFFSYYMGINEYHQSRTKPLFWLQTKFPGWLIQAKDFARTQTKKAGINDFALKQDYSEKQAF